MIYEYYWKLPEQTVVSQILLIMGDFFLFSVRKTYFQILWFLTLIFLATTQALILLQSFTRFTQNWKS